MNTSNVATDDHTLHQPASVPANPRWGPATHQDAQSESARYVHNVNVNTYGGSTPFAPNTHWENFPDAVNPESHFTPIYGQTAAMEGPENHVSISSVEHTSPMDIAFRTPFAEFVQEPWNVLQDAQEEDLEPD
jgi:hypothetical protein